MNKELKGLMGQYHITRSDLEPVLGNTRKTIGSKISNGTFTQIDLIKLYNFFLQYDRNLDANIFLKDKLPIE